MAQLLPGAGRPDDVADAVLFLASDEARFITAEILNIDGGVAGKM
jgi:3-oxoacyl-[acyl-carrier protein] reductase